MKKQIFILSLIIWCLSSALVCANVPLMPASLHAAENADNGALTVFADEYADSVSLPKMLETGNFWMQLEVLFSKVWNGEDVTTLVEQLAGTIAEQVGSTEN